MNKIIQNSEPFSDNALLQLKYKITTVRFVRIIPAVYRPVADFLVEQLSFQKIRTSAVGFVLGIGTFDEHVASSAEWQTFAIATLKPMARFCREN